MKIKPEERVSDKKYDAKLLHDMLVTTLNFLDDGGDGEEHILNRLLYTHTGVYDFYLNHVLPQRKGKT